MKGEEEKVKEEEKEEEVKKGTCEANCTPLTFGLHETVNFLLRLQPNILANTNGAQINRIFLISVVLKKSQEYSKTQTKLVI